MNNKALESGLVKMSQLINPNGTLLNVETICQRFDISVLDCNALLLAIPRKWKKVLKDYEMRKSYCSKH